MLTAAGPGHIEAGPVINLFAGGPPELLGLPVNTFITILLLVAVEGEAQVAFEVIVTVTLAPEGNEVVVYVLLSPV